MPVTNMPYQKEFLYNGSNPELSGLSLTIKGWSAKLKVSYSSVYSRARKKDPKVLWDWVDNLYARDVLDSVCGYKECDNPANSLNMFCSPECKDAEYKRLKDEGILERVCRNVNCKKEFLYKTNGSQMYCSAKCSKADAENRLKVLRKDAVTFNRDTSTRPEECKTCEEYAKCLEDVAMHDAPWPISTGKQCYNPEKPKDIGETHGRLQSGGRVLPYKG